MPIRRSLAAGGTCVVLALSLTTRAAEPFDGQFGREGTIKIRVSAAAAKAQLLAQGARLVADYGAFAVLESPAGEAVPGNDAEAQTTGSRQCARIVERA